MESCAELVLIGVAVGGALGEGRQAAWRRLKRRRQPDEEEEG